MRLTVACFLITSGLFAADPWTKSQVALELGYQAALLCDWRQTSDYHKTWNTNDPIIETNPLLGSHPKQSTINQWCILSSVGHIAITNYLPSKRRSLWQGSTMAIEIMVVSHNQLNCKVRINF